MNHVIPPLALLGIIERATRTEDVLSQYSKLNIIGLKQVCFSYLFPLDLHTMYFAFAVYTPVITLETFTLVIRDDAGRKLGEMAVTLSTSDNLESLGKVVGEQTDDEVRSSGVFHLPGWLLMPLAADSFGMMIPRAGTYSFFAAWNGEEILAGQIHFDLVDPQPLSPSRIAALRSDPKVAKYVRFTLGCQYCKDELKAYAGLERHTNDYEFQNSLTWYENLADSYSCKCGSVNSFELTIYRRNLHGLLGSPVSPQGKTRMTPLYETGALTDVFRKFRSLLDRDEPEETFQVFLEENPVVLHHFTPQRIFFKAPILTAFKSDFAVLTPQRELLLIELEKPKTKILKRDGGVHSELQHAFDQVNSWLHVADEQRIAVLDCIGIDRHEVGSVRTVVVAGRDSGHDHDFLRRLKGVDRGRTKFMTYDDLLCGFLSLVQTVERL